MQYFARYLFIIPTCLLATSSWSQPLEHDVADAAVVAQSAEPALQAPASKRSHLASSMDSSMHKDGWLAGLLGVGLIALQLYRKQQTLQAPRLMN